jgi:oligosaccharide repeat unit polymerase
MFLYELKLVYYYDLTTYTWFIIFIFQIVYIVGCIIGKTLIIKKGTNVAPLNITPNLERDLMRSIILLTIIASIGIISNVIIGIKQYGFNLLKFTNQLYAARLSGDIDSGIPYLSSFIYPALILEGFYISKFKFKKILIIPVVLLIFNALKSAGRLDIIQGLFFIIVPIFLNKVKKDKRKATKLTKKNKFWTAITIAVFVVIFAIITVNRSSWIEINSYMSPLMIKLVEIEPAIYKTYVYLTTPIGVLNEFLKDPTFNFGGHTFLTLYNFLNKFGFEIPTSQYQHFYQVPITSNVGSYIRELIEDFGVPLAILVTFFTGFLYSYSYRKYSSNRSYLSLIWTTAYSFIVIFSFYMWQVRSSTMWILLTVGTLFAYNLDRKEQRRRRRHEYNDCTELQRP